MSWLESTEPFLTMRTKLNNLADLLIMTETSAVLEVGTHTSISTEAMESNTVKSGELLWLEDKDTGELTEIELTASNTMGDPLSIVEIELTSEIPSGSKIYFSMKNILRKING